MQEKKNNIVSKKGYKLFCEENHLRYALEPGGNPISPTKRRLHDDHLYWTGGEKVGVYIERPTKTRYNNMKKKLLELGCEIEVMQDADIEGTFFIDPKDARRVAALIGATKNNVSEKNRQKMRDRMNHKWDQKRGVSQCVHP